MTKEELKEYGMRVTQASRTELIVLMYEITEKYLEKAIKYLDEGDIQSFENSVGKAKDFVNELTAILDMKYKISYELRNIYLFMNKVLVRATIRRDTTEIKAIIPMLEQLRQAYSTIADTDNSGPMMENTEQLYAGLTYSKSSLNVDLYQDQKRGFTV